MTKKRNGRANGFSMVELIIAAGLIGIIVLFAAQFGDNFSKNKNTVQKFVEQSSFGAYGARFIKIAETADLSSLFLHLPIATNCSSLDVPCLRKIDPATGELSDFSGIDLPKNFEFYRDKEGIFVPIKASSIKASATFDAYSLANKNLMDTAMTSNVNQSSVVWPLKSPSSPEFPVLTRSASDVSFSFVRSSASSSAAYGQYILTTYIAGKLGSLTDLLGSPVIVYNPYYPQQYVVQYLSEIVACKTNIPLCKLKFQSASINENHVMIVLKEIQPAQYGAFAPNLKNYSMFSSTASGDWSYLFPTKTPNLKAVTSASASDLVSPLAIPKWGHFYDANAMTPYDLFIMPVRWSIYYLKSVPNKPDYFSLVRKDFNGLKAFTETTEISLLKGSVTFSRKIGTKNLKFSLYGEAE